MDEQETGICNQCGTVLAGEYEDMHPDGIGHYELVGYKPCVECEDNEHECDIGPECNCEDCKNYEGSLGPDR